MRQHLPWISLLLFVLALAYDLAVWGAAPALPHGGRAIVQAAAREAPLASTYIRLGAPLARALPPVQEFGARRLRAAYGDSFDILPENPAIAMDLLFHGRAGGRRAILFAYYAAPVLLLLAVAAWLRRPRQVRSLGRG